MPQTLHGLGGVGKTQLATEYAYRHRDDYDIVWWIPAEDSAHVRASLTRLAQRLRIAADEDPATLVLDALATRRMRWLLIYDNAASPAGLNGLVPSGGAGHVVVTSRNNASWSTHGTTIEVNVFDRAESIELLRQYDRRIGAADADRLAAALGDLPVALVQAASWRAETDMTTAEYLGLFAANPVELLSEGRPIDYPETVVDMARTAMGRLRKCSPAAAELLELVAFLGPEPVSVRLLRAGCGGVLSPILAGVLGDPIAFARVVREIRRCGLARGNGRSIQVHPLIRRVLRAENGSTCATVRQLLAGANPGSPDDPATWPLHAEIAAHADAAHLSGATDEMARRVMVDQIRYRYAIGHFEASRDLARDTIAEWRAADSGGADHELLLEVCRHLANAYRQLGDFAAAEELDSRTHRQLVADPRFGADHRQTLCTANNLGVDLRLTGDFAGALRIDQETADRHRSILSEDESTWRALNNVAVSQRHLGRYEEAREIDESNLRQRRERFGESDVRTAFTMANLARDHHGLGDYRRSLELLRPAVRLYAAALRPDHLDRLLGDRAMAVALRKCGRFEEARDHARQTYQDHRARFGGPHEHTLSAEVSYANALRCGGGQETLREARALLREAVDDYRALFGAEHLLTLAATVNLAAALRAAGDPVEARGLGETALAALRRTVGERHPYTLIAAGGLAHDLALTGEPERAARLSWETYELSVAVRGPDHPDTLACAVGAALDKLSVGDDAGRELLANTTETLARVLGREHPDTRDAAAGHRLVCDIEAPPS